MFPIVFVLIVLHGPDGREIDVSVDEITSMQCKFPDRENRLFAEGINTLINLSDGKYVSVRETCAEVKDIIEAKQREVP